MNSIFEPFTGGESELQHLGTTARNNDAALRDIHAEHHEGRPSVPPQLRVPVSMRECSVDNEGECDISWTEMGARLRAPTYKIEPGST